MAIERTTAYSNEPDITLINRDIDAVFSEVNRGIDPTTLPPGKLTADKMRFSTYGTGQTGYSLNGAAQIPAGGVYGVTFNVVGPVSGIGVISGQYYNVTPYIDFFVDPTGSGGATLSNIYGTSGIFPASGVTCGYYIKNSSSPTQPYLFSFQVWAHNFDTVPHYVYTAFQLYVLNTQASTT